MAIKDYWGVDDNTIVMIVDRGNSKSGMSNILNFNVGKVLLLPVCCSILFAACRPASLCRCHCADQRVASDCLLPAACGLLPATLRLTTPTRRQGVELNLPPIFWTRLRNYFGTTYYVKDNGEDVAIINAVDTVVGCLREGFCTDVPKEMKDIANGKF